MRRWAGPVGLVARLVVGGVWLWAGLIKLPHLESSVTAVRGYQLLPPGMTDTVGRLLPMVEVAIGLCLLLGLLTRVSGVLSALLQVAFIVGIASVWARGIAINCGCFGDGGAVSQAEAFAKYPWEIARDVGLLALSLWLVVRPRTPFALDSLLFPPASRPPSPGDPSEEENRVHVES